MSAPARSPFKEMFTAVSTGLIVFVIVALFLLMARRVVSIALKLALVVLMVVLLFGTAAFGWWRGWFSAPKTQRPTTQSNQRPNSNRRPTPR
jgi:heme A synthase